MESFRFDCLDHSDSSRAAIVDLRRIAFQRKFASQIDLAGLEWNQTDAESVHFGVWNEGALVSTLRLTQIEDARRFEDILLFPGTDAFADVPCAVLARAATDAKFVGLNLGMKLRVTAYEYWLSNAPVTARYIFGTALADSKRLETLRSWGYEFAQNEKPWAGHLKSKGDVAVFRMERSKLKLILAELKRLHG
jgi:hypothetical protein